jgi:hypothetical protein
MLLSAIPTKFGSVWGNAAGAGYIRTIPSASQIGVHDGWASLADGFPPLNFVAVTSGGVPPFGQDHNGILKWVTQWLQWHEAGGTIRYDAAFATAIGGYPQGAVVQSTTNGYFWINAVDNNASNPDSGGTNWKLFEGFPRIWSALNTFQAGAYSTGFDVGGANFRANGGGSNSFVVRVDGSNTYFLISDTAAGGYNAKRPITIAHSNGQVTIGGNGEPVAVGTGGLSVSSTVTANAARLSFGAYGSGDVARAVRLGDFTLSGVPGTFYEILPNGLIIEGFGGAIGALGTGTPYSQNFTVPLTFPNNILFTIATWGGFTPPNTGTIAANVASPSQVTISINAPSGPSYGFTCFVVGY